MVDLIDRIKRYFNFDKEEVKSIIISSLIFGFIFSFRDWGAGATFDAMYGLRSLITAILIVIISILVHVSAQKITGLQIGGEVRFRIWWYGIIIALILTFISNGRLWWLIIPGGVTMKIIPEFRLGKFRYGLDYLKMGIIAFAGPLANIVLGSIFKNIELYLPFTIMSSVLVNKIFLFSLAYAVVSSLPIPPLDGQYMFYGSRLWYVLIFGMILVYFILVSTLQIYSWIFAIIGGVLIWLLYYIWFEKSAW